MEATATRNRPWLLIGACLSYLAFCLTLFTPAHNLAMLWPYFFMVATGPLHGLSEGDFVSIAIGDAFGLIAIIGVFAPLSRSSWLRIHPGISAVVGALSWPILIVAIQILTWFVARLLGWPVGI